MHKLVYTDENDLRTYESLPEKDFKEFFMAYFKYNKGDKIDITDFTNPITFALFNSYIPKLDKNEDTYNKKVNANRENGKKGGRPRKSALQEVTTTEFDITPNTDDLSTSNSMDDNQYQPEVETTPETLKTTNNNEIQDNDMGYCIGTFEENKKGYNKDDISLFPDDSNVCYNDIVNKPSKETKSTSSNIDVLQQLINDDDNFCKVYSNCIKAMADSELNPRDFVKSNSKNIAMEKLKRMMNENKLTFTKEVMEFIKDDVNYIMTEIAAVAS